MARWPRTLVGGWALGLACWGMASQWQPLGPFGGSVTSLAVDPLNASTVYAVTDSAGLFGSLDGGWSWQPLGWLGPDVTSLEASPAAPGTLFASFRGTLPGTGGVLKSTDGGRNWSPARFGLGDPSAPPSSSEFRYLTINAVAAHATDPAILLAASAGPSGLLRSTSGGASWSRVAFQTEVYDVIFDPQTPQTAFASVHDPGRDAPRGGVFRSSDGGITWAAARSGLLRNPGKEEYYASPTRLVPAPSDPRTIYGLSRREVVRTTDGAANWSTISPPVPAAVDAAFTGLAVSPTDAREIWAVTLQRGLWHSRDGGTTWRALTSLQCGADNAGAVHTTSLALLALPGQSGALLLGRQDLGVARSSDGGLSWSESTAGLLAARVRAVAAADAPARSLWAATDNGAWRSPEGGETWQRASEGLAPACDARRQDGAGQPPDCNSVTTLLAVKGGSLVAQTACGVAASSNDGAAWTAVLPPGFSPATIATVPGRVALHALVQNSVWRSLDGGHTWTGCGTGPWGSDPATALAVDPDLADVVVVLTPATAWVSCAACTSWTRIISVRPLECPGGSALQTYAAAIVSRGPEAPSPSCGSTYSATVLAGTSCGLFLSTQSGRVWRRVAAEGLAVEGLAADPDRPGEVYAAARGAGVLHSTDFGTTWKPFNEGLPTLECTSLALDAPRRMLYVGTDGAGVFGRTLARSARRRLVGR